MKVPTLILLAAISAGTTACGSDLRCAKPKDRGQETGVDGAMDTVFEADDDWIQSASSKGYARSLTPRQTADLKRFAEANPEQRRLMFEGEQVYCPAVAAAVFAVDALGIAFAGAGLAADNVNAAGGEDWGWARAPHSATSFDY